MITMQELTMGRDKQFPKDFTKEIQQNLNVLLEKLNIIRAKYGAPMIINSGWRSPTINAATPGAAKASKHLVGLAADIRDEDGKFWAWCIENLELLQELGCYLENKRYTKNWTHVQIGAPASGRRIFRPSNSPPPHPELWDEVYDTKFDKI